MVEKPSPTTSTTESAGWKKVNADTKGNTFYVDFERIRKVDGYVYYWTLVDFLKPLNNKLLSIKVYYQGDCKLFRAKKLSFFGHKEPMGGGAGKSYQFAEKLEYPPPNSPSEIVLKFVCSR